MAVLDHNLNLRAVPVLVAQHVLRVPGWGAGVVGGGGVAGAWGHGGVANAWGGGGITGRWGWLIAAATCRGGGGNIAVTGGGSGLVSRGGGGGLVGGVVLWVVHTPWGGRSVWTTG